MVTYTTAGGVRPAAGTAFTQTYATASHTVTAPTAVSVATTGATAVTPNGYTTADQANAIVTNLNAVITDVDALRQVVNGIIDELQANDALN